MFICVQAVLPDFLNLLIQEEHYIRFVFEYMLDMASQVEVELVQDPSPKRDVSRQASKLSISKTGGKTRIESYTVNPLNVSTTIRATEVLLRRLKGLLCSHECAKDLMTETFKAALNFGEDRLAAVLLAEGYMVELEQEMIDTCIHGLLLDTCYVIYVVNRQRE